MQEYRDSGISGERARRPGLDALIADARRKKFSVVLVAAFDRVARSVKHFLQVMDEFDSLGVVFISRRENVDTSGPMGRLFLTLIGSIAELESDLIRERVLAGMRRARLDGVRIGRAPMNLDRAAIVRDRLGGMTLTAVSKNLAIVNGSTSAEGALDLGANFVLSKLIQQIRLRSVLDIAITKMELEHRRYFRCDVDLPVRFRNSLGGNLSPPA